MDTNHDDPLEVFAGTGWEVAIVQSLLENAEIMVYIRHSGKGTMAPWESGGSLPSSSITVSNGDYEKAKQVVDQYYETLKK